MEARGAPARPSRARAQSQRGGESKGRSRRSNQPRDLRNFPIPMWTHRCDWGERELLALIALASNSVYVSEGDWIEYFPGNCPLVIAAPHDGTLRPKHMARRNFGIMVRDTGTKGLAATIALHFLRSHGVRPHLLVCHLTRTRLDVNRVREQAASDPSALRAWDCYHDTLQSACKAASVVSPGSALFLDIHAQANYRFNGCDIIELGTLCPSAVDMQKGTAHLEGLVRARLMDNLDAEQIHHNGKETCQAQLMGLFTMPRLAARVLREGGSFAQLICGPSSLGALLDKYGYQAIPSLRLPKPLACNKNTTPSSARTHSLVEEDETTEASGALFVIASDEDVARGSNHAPFFCGSSSYPLQKCHELLDSLQIECPVRLSRDPDSWAPLADALLRSLEELWQTHLQQSLTGCDLSIQKDSVLSRCHADNECS